MLSFELPYSMARSCRNRAALDLRFLVVLNFQALSCVDWIKLPWMRNGRGIKDGGVKERRDGALDYAVACARFR